MIRQQGSLWGPLPLADLVVTQLESHGFAPGDAARCAQHIAASPGPAASSSLFVDLGSCKFLEGDIDGAVAAWRKSIASGPEAVGARALLNLGLLYEHLCLYERAINVLASVVERGLEPHASDASMALARCYQASDQAEAAMETMARLAETTMARGGETPRLTETLLGLGEIALQAGRHDRAERAWRAASVTNESPQRTAAINQLASLYIDLGHDDELIGLVERHPAVQISPSLLLTRAQVLQRSGDQEQAVVLANAAAGLSVTDRFNLAELRVHLGLVNEAIDELEALLGEPAIEVQQHAAFALGEVYRSYEMTDAATSMYERVLSEGDRYWSPKAALVLGDMASSAGDDTAAAGYWNQAQASTIARISMLGAERLAEQDEASSEHIDPATTPAATATQVEVAAESAVPSEPVVEEPDPAPMVEVTPEPIVEAEPVVVLLDSLDDDMDTELPEEAEAFRKTLAATALGAADATDQTDSPESLIELQPEGDVEHGITIDGGDDDLNPYAALAPDGGWASDVAPSNRNPYAELAPNYESAFAPGADVEPGDWESMLEWEPADTIPEESEPKKRSSAFSRYT